MYFGLNETLPSVLCNFFSVKSWLMISPCWLFDANAIIIIDRANEDIKATYNR